MEMEDAFKDILAKMKPANVVVHSATKMFKHQRDVCGESLKQDEC
jgi:cystathionine beta-lyase/cystathionine gamma-synthase